MIRPRQRLFRLGQRGFTLVELLIAFALLSLITLVLFSGLRLASRTWEAVENQAERTGELRLATDFLRRALSRVQPIALQVEGALVGAFNGDRQRIEFVAPLVDPVALPGLYLLRYELIAEGSRQHLLLTRWLVHPEILSGEGDHPPWEPLTEDTGRSSAPLDLEAEQVAGAFGRTLLIEDLEDLEFAYFGIADGTSEPDWHEDWLGQSTLPGLVSVRLITSGTQADRPWPAITVALPGWRP